MSAIRRLLVSLCLASVCAAAAFGEPAPPLLIGGDFETGAEATPSGWSLSLYPDAQPARGCLSRSGERTRTGDWALRVDTGPVVGQDLVLIFNGAVSDAAPALRGQPLRLSGFVYIEPGTALRPIHMRLRTFGPDEQGQNAFLGDVLETTVFGEPGTWAEFHASGVVPDRQATSMDLHCGVGADAERTVQYLDDLRVELPESRPLAIRPLRASLWRDESVVPVAVTVAEGGPAGAPVSLSLLNAGGEQVASWERTIRAGPVGLPLPTPAPPEGRYALRARTLDAEGNELSADEAPLELVGSPWEHAPSEGLSTGPVERIAMGAAFGAMGTVAPTDALDAVPDEAEPISEDVPLTPWQDRGYVVFSRHVLDPPTRLGRPRPGECGPLRLLASPGEYEAGTLSVWGLRQQAGVSVTVSDLRGARSGIDRNCVDVRAVRGPQGLPAFLEQRPSVDIPEGQTQTFWLTVQVPREAGPGYYRGSVTVSPEGGQPTEVELLLRVLPLELPAVRKGYGFWWAMDGRWKGYYSDTRDAALEQIRKQFVVLREHGCNMVSLPGMPKMTQAADGTIAYDFAEDHWGHSRFSCEDFIRLGRETAFLSLEQPIQYVGAESLHSDWIAKELGFDQASPAFDGFYRDACRRVDDWAKQQGFTLGFACVDEIGNGADRQRDASRFYRDAWEAGVLTSVTDNSMHGGVHLMARPRFDGIVSERLYNFITPEMIESARASDDRLWLYNLGSAGWSARMDRFVFGLFTERCGAEGCAQWAFQWPQGEAGPWAAAEAGQSAGWHYALPAPDGPLPTLALEGVREGIDDARYLTLLEATSPGAPEASLTDIEPLSPRIGEYLETHDANALDVRRWRIARAAMAARR